MAGLGAAGRRETIPWELDGSVLSHALNGKPHLGAGLRSWSVLRGGRGNCRAPVVLVGVYSFEARKELPTAARMSLTESRLCWSSRTGQSRLGRCKPTWEAKATTNISALTFCLSLDFKRFDLSVPFPRSLLGCQQLMLSEEINNLDYERGKRNAWRSSASGAQLCEKKDLPGSRSCSSGRAGACMFSR